MNHTVNRTKLWSCSIEHILRGPGRLRVNRERSRRARHNGVRAGCVCRGIQCTRVGQGECPIRILGDGQRRLRDCHVIAVIAELSQKRSPVGREGNIPILTRVFRPDIHGGWHGRQGLIVLAPHRLAEQFPIHAVGAPEDRERLSPTLDAAPRIRI